MLTNRCDIYIYDYVNEKLDRMIYLRNRFKRYINEYEKNAIKHGYIDFDKLNAMKQRLNEIDKMIDKMVNEMKQYAKHEMIEKIDLSVYDKIEKKIKNEIINGRLII